jgi:preprotein translocase subunit SecY
MSLITFQDLFLALIAVPSNCCKSYGCSTILGNVFGGTSLIIMVGVAIDTMANKFILVE